MTDEERAALAQQLQGGHGHARGDGHEHRPNPFTDSNTRVLAIASGKGGVGKSSVTTNLAVALAQRGHKVAAVDADVWGFSMPRMLGIDRPPTVIDDVIVPPDANGVTLISMGFFAREDQPVVWRGPMLHKALEQFLTDVHWGEPDYLIVDMPPGTGDIALSMAQFLPRAEVIVVTTPQPAAQKVAQRAAYMARKVNLSGDRRDREHVVVPRAITAPSTGSSAKAAARSSPTSSKCRCSVRCRSSPELRAGRRRRRADRGRRSRRRGVAGVRGDGRAARRRARAQAHLPNRAQDRLTAVGSSAWKYASASSTRPASSPSRPTTRSTALTAAIDSAMSKRRRAVVAHRHEGPAHRRAGRQDRLRRGRGRRGWPQGRLRRRASRGRSRERARARAARPASACSSRARAASARARWRRRPRCSRRASASACCSIEVDAKGDVPAQFEHAPVGFTPREIHPGVLAMAMDTEASLQEYLRLNLRVPVLGRLGPLARVLDFVATAAPGVKEILTIGKIAWEVREAIEGRADHDLVDRRRGRDRSHRRPARRGRRDPRARRRRAAAQPDAVGLRAARRSRDHRGQRRHDARGDAGRGDDRARRPHPRRGRRPARHRDRQPRAARAVHARRRGDVRSAACAAPLERADRARSGAGATEVLDAARLAVSLRRTRAAHLEHLRQSVDLPLLYVPYLFVRAHGLRVTRMVADALGAELGL